MSIAIELMRQLESLAAENEVDRIEEITVAGGVMRQVVPEALEIAFAAISEGTCAEGATLHLEITPIAAECRACGCRFKPDIDAFLCPQCHAADAHIVEGDDIILKSITCEQKDGALSHED